jgi:nucleoside-diphosphate-sugar epimerase
MKPVVLVTGITGFTGALMRTELESNGYQVAGTALFGPLPGDRVLDIESAALCKAVIAEVAPDYVIHLAGIAFVQSDPVKLYAANVVGTVNLLDALAGATHPVRKVVLASSANVYGNREGTLISESEEARPANHYATSKLAMEKMAANYFERLPIIITRPFNYTGVGQSTDFLVPKIVAHFAKRAPSIELGNIDVERDFSDVEMVAKVYRKLIESQSRSLVVNICTGKATSLSQIIAMMEEIAGYRIEVRSNPAFIRPNDIKHLTGDPTAMIAATGKLDARPIRAMLEDMYRSFQ